MLGIVFELISESTINLCNLYIPGTSDVVIPNVLRPDPKFNLISILLINVVLILLLKYINKK